MQADTLQNIDEVIVRVDVVQAARDEQALHDPDVLGAKLGPTEVPVFPAHRNHAQRALEMVGVDRHVRIRQNSEEATI